MDKDLQSFKDEQSKLNIALQDIEKEKNTILTRLIEIQGIIKYLTSASSESKLEESKVEPKN